MDKRYKPLVDKLYYLIISPTLLLLACNIALSFYAPVMFFVSIPTTLVVLYFFITPLFGYVELRKDTVFIKFGFILKEEIPYNKIRGVMKERKAYSDSTVSLKCALDHVNIKYNKVDFVSVSVKGNDELVDIIDKLRCG